MTLKVGIASVLLKSKFLWLYTWEKYAKYIKICLMKDHQNVQTSSGAHPFSYLVGTGVVSRV